MSLHYATPPRLHLIGGNVEVQCRGLDEKPAIEVADNGYGVWRWRKIPTKFHPRRWDDGRARKPYSSKVDCLFAARCAIADILVEDKSFEHNGKRLDGWRWSPRRGDHIALWSLTYPTRDAALAAALEDRACQRV